MSQGYLITGGQWYHRTDFWGVIIHVEQSASGLLYNRESGGITEHLSELRFHYNWESKRIIEKSRLGVIIEKSESGLPYN